MDKILKAWRQAHGERAIGNGQAAINAEAVAKKLEERQGLAVWTLDRRRRPWVPALWRRTGSQFGVLVLIDSDRRLVLLGPLDALGDTRSRAVTLENSLAKKANEVAWGTIARLPAALPTHLETEEAYLPWASVRLHCEVEREPAIEVD